jgi:hypothetical protein
MRCLGVVLAIAVLCAELTQAQPKGKSIECDQHSFAQGCMSGITAPGARPLQLQPAPSKVPSAAKPGSAAPVKMGKPSARHEAVLPPPPPVSPQRPSVPQPTVVTVGEADWRFADPSASLVGGVNVDSLLHSELVHKVLQELASKMGQGAELLSTLAENSGISQIHFSVGEQAGKPAVLLLTYGALHDATVAALTQQGNVQMRRVDLMTTLFGSGADLEQAARRLQATQPVLRPALLRQAKELAADSDVWVAGSIPQMKGVSMAMPFEELSLGLRMQHDVQLTMNVNAGSPKKAQDLADQILKSPQADLASMGVSINATVNGSSVKVLFGMNGDRVRQAITEAFDKNAGPGISGLARIAGLANALSGPGLPTGLPAASSAAAPAAAPATSARQKAVIYGLDDGPREVPLGPQP